MFDKIQMILMMKATILNNRILPLNNKIMETRKATRCNNRDDLLHLSFTLKISIFSEAYI